MESSQGPLQSNEGPGCRIDPREANETLRDQFSVEIPKCAPEQSYADRNNIRLALLILPPQQASLSLFDCRYNPRIMSPIILFLASLGAFSLFLIIARVFTFLIQYVFTSFSFKSFEGKWAVVTGASAGIGAGFVRALASRGLNVVLIARSKDKMDALASEVSTKHGVKTHVISFDFNAADAAAYAKIASILTPLSPTVLVNNVGVNVEMPTDFVDLELDVVDRIVKVNISSINNMTAMLLPGMIRAGKGIVINMSSGGGVVLPAPMLAVYAGTKAYADAFALALYGEVKDKGVLAVSMTPFFVESAMAKMRKSFTVPSADVFADKALQQVAVSPRLSPHWIHEIMGEAARRLPLKVQVERVNKLHRSIRARAIRKKERMAKQN